MDIPYEAVEAAREAFEADGWSTRGMLDGIIPAAIKAAAPFIAADIREELRLVRAERDWMKEQLGRLHLDTLGEYADSLEEPQ